MDEIVDLLSALRTDRKEHGGDRSRVDTSGSDGSEAGHPVEWSPPPYDRCFGRFPTTLGVGASKLVYEAIDMVNGKLVAWNEVPVAYLSDEERDRVLSEIGFLRQVKHDHIIDFHAAWSTTDKLVFITAICDGRDLQTFYREHAHVVKLKVIKKWCRQILSGLDYLHSRTPPIIHRDIKCSNFLYDASGQIKIGDLGLCTRSGVKCALTELGTPQYMAPEVYQGVYNEGCDIYAFGMSVLEMVTKRLPYSECNNYAQIFKMVTKGVEPQALRFIKYDSISEFIRFCIHQKPDGSRPTAKEVLAHPFLVETATSPEDEEVDLVWPGAAGPEDDDGEGDDGEEQHSSEFLPEGDMCPIDDSSGHAQDVCYVAPDDAPSLNPQTGNVVMQEKSDLLPESFGGELEDHRRLDSVYSEQYGESAYEGHYDSSVHTTSDVLYGDATPGFHDNYLHPGSRSYDEVPSITPTGQTDNLTYTTSNASASHHPDPSDEHINVLQSPSPSRTASPAPHMDYRSALMSSVGPTERDTHATHSSSDFGHHMTYSEGDDRYHHGGSSYDHIDHSMTNASYSHMMEHGHHEHEQSHGGQSYDDVLLHHRRHHSSLDNEHADLAASVGLEDGPLEEHERHEPSASHDGHPFHSRLSASEPLEEGHYGQVSPAGGVYAEDQQYDGHHEWHGQPRNSYTSVDENAQYHMAHRESNADEQYHGHEHQTADAPTAVVGTHHAHTKPMAEPATASPAVAAALGMPAVAIASVLPPEEQHAHGENIAPVIIMHGREISTSTGDTGACMVAVQPSFPVSASPALVAKVDALVLDAVANVAPGPAGHIGGTRVSMENVSAPVVSPRARNSVSFNTAEGGRQATSISDIVLLTLQINHDEQKNGSFSRLMITFEFDRNVADTTTTAREVVQSLKDLQQLQVDDSCVPMFAAFLAAMQFDTSVTINTGAIARYRWHSVVLKSVVAGAAQGGAATPFTMGGQLPATPSLTSALEDGTSSIPTFSLTDGTEMEAGSTARPSVQEEAAGPSGIHAPASTMQSEPKPSEASSVTTPALLELQSPTFFVTPVQSIVQPLETPFSLTSPQMLNPGDLASNDSYRTVIIRDQSSTDGSASVSFPTNEPSAQSSTLQASDAASHETPKAESEQPHTPSQGVAESTTTDHKSAHSSDTTVTAEHTAKASSEHTSSPAALHVSAPVVDVSDTEAGQGSPSAAQPSVSSKASTGKPSVNSPGAHDQKTSESSNSGSPQQQQKGRSHTPGTQTVDPIDAMIIQLMGADGDVLGRSRRTSDASISPKLKALQEPLQSQQQTMQQQKQVLAPPVPTPTPVVWGHTAHFGHPMYVPPAGVTHHHSHLHPHMPAAASATPDSFAFGWHQQPHTSAAIARHYTT